MYESRPSVPFDYDAHGASYASTRVTDPEIGERVRAALGDAKSVVNVGAGVGSYEPADRYVIAVEPSVTMRRRRREINAVPAVDATAESLPFDGDAFDAAMAMVTIHHWSDWRAGVAELKRVARDRVVILTFDPEHICDMWLADYFSSMMKRESARYPTMGALAAALGECTRIESVPVPLDCRDGFLEAYYGRPEAFLDRGIRHNQSAWALEDSLVTENALEGLRADLASGRWDATYGHLRSQKRLCGSLRLVVWTR